jgi:hypothetical protein
MSQQLQQLQLILLKWFDEIAFYITTSNSPTAPSLHQSIPPGNPINIGDKSAPVDDENEIAELMSTLNPMPTDWPVSGHDDQEQADYFGRNYHY